MSNFHPNFHMRFSPQYFYTLEDSPANIYKGSPRSNPRRFFVIAEAFHWPQQPVSIAGSYPGVSSQFCDGFFHGADGCRFFLLLDRVDHFTSNISRWPQGKVRFNDAHLTYRVSCILSVHSNGLPHYVGLWGWRRCM